MFYMFECMTAQCSSHLKVPLPSSSLISRLTVKVNRSLSGVRGAGCCADRAAFLAERRNAVAKLYSILLTCRTEVKGVIIHHGNKNWPSA